MKEIALKNNRPFIILGSGGNASVLLDAIQGYSCVIHGVCDPKFKDCDKKVWNDISILGDDSYLEEIDKDKFYLVNGIGGLKSTAKVRADLYAKYINLGYIFPKIVHKNAYVSLTSKISNGVQIMAGATIQTNAAIEENVLINTNASVDHDTFIGANSNIAPGVTICGSCFIGKNVFIGTGSTIINNIKIEDGSFIKAGSIITNDVLKQ